jgi:hypothetical protein
MHISNITKFASWNGFSKRLTNKLLESFTLKLLNNLSNDHVVVTVQNSNNINLSNDLVATCHFIHPPSGFIYLSLVKEATPLFTTALRKLTVCSRNLLNSSP